jgi:pimeloyl-ACP methyl ester carboxylesterase
MHILMVHGAAHDENCWNELTPYLIAHGFRVHTLTLRGHGRSQYSGYRISMSIYAEDVCHEAELIGEPCVLMGHSMGGMVISSAAEARSDLFSHLIYLAAFVPKQHGSSMLMLELSLKKKYPAAKKTAVKNFSLLQGTIKLNNEKCKETFYNKCSGDLLEIANRYLGRQPIRPFFSRVAWTEERLGSIPKIYIECTLDNAININMQRIFQTQMQFSCVKSIASDHSPFLSMPEELATCIAEALA